MKLKNILIVDDECDIRSLSKCVLTRFFPGYTIKDVSSIAEAKRQLSSFSPDIVLLDLHLTDGVGFELMPLIVKSNPKAKVLVVTAYNQQEEIDQAINLGAFGLLGKPFQAETLVDWIRKMNRGSE